MGRGGVSTLKRRLQAAIFTQVAPGAQPGLCCHQGSHRTTARGSLEQKLSVLISKKTYRCVVKKEWVKEESCYEKEHQGQEKYHQSQHKALWIVIQTGKWDLFPTVSFSWLGKAKGQPMAQQTTGRLSWAPLWHI